MMRWLGMALLAGLLAGCGSFESSVVGPPDRLEIGVSAARPDAGAAPPDAAVTRQLDWKVAQICTHGEDRVAQETEPAEQGQQLVDRRLRCEPYRLSIFGVPAPLLPYF